MVEKQPCRANSPSLPSSPPEMAWSARTGSKVSVRRPAVRVHRSSCPNVSSHGKLRSDHDERHVPRDPRAPHSIPNDARRSHAPRPSAAAGRTACGDVRDSVSGRTGPVPPVRRSRLRGQGRRFASADREGDHLDPAVPRALLDLLGQRQAPGDAVPEREPPVRHPERDRCVRAEGRARHRGPQVLRARAHRRVLDHPSSHRQHPRREGGAGRVDHQPAAHQEHRDGRRAHLPAEVPGGPGRDPPGEDLPEEPDLRAVSQPGLPRLPGLRDRDGRRLLLRGAGQQAHARPGGAPGRHAAGPG